MPPSPPPSSKNWYEWKNNDTQQFVGSLSWKRKKSHTKQTWGKHKNAYNKFSVVEVIYGQDATKSEYNVRRSKEVVFFSICKVTSHRCAAHFMNICLTRKENKMQKWFFTLWQELKSNLTHMGRHNRMLERPSVVELNSANLCKFQFNYWVII